MGDVLGDQLGVQIRLLYLFDIDTCGRGVNLFNLLFEFGCASSAPADDYAGFSGGDGDRYQVGGTTDLNFVNSGPTAELSLNQAADGQIILQEVSVVTLVGEPLALRQSLLTWRRMLIGLTFCPH